MDKNMILHPLQQRDPRLDLDDRALVAASRNAFPVVASRVARRDGMGLAAGAAGALFLGGITFWSMSDGREGVTPPYAQQARTAVSAREEPLPPIAPATQRPAPTPMPVALQTPSPTIDRARAPVMVFDMSPTPFAPTAGSPTTAATGSAPRPGSQQPLSENEAFASRIGDGAVDVASASAMADPANTVTQGTLIPAVLETAIDSDLPGYVRAVVSQDVRSFDGSRILIPRSSRLIGQYKSGLAAGQTRAYILWSRLIRPDGASVALASPATDFSGRTGLSGEVDGHFMKRFGSAMLLSVVGAAGAIGSGGASLILSGGQSAASVAAQRDAQIPPTIRVRQGQPIRIFTARDLDFSTVATGEVGQ